MGLIKIQSNIEEVQRIVAYGCSYTAGTELADEDFIPGAEQLKPKLGIMKFNRKYYDILSSKECLEKQSERVWVKHLANKIGVPVINRAAGGTGLEDHITKFRYDIATKVIRKTDLVILGITSMNRWVEIAGQNGAVYNHLSHTLDKRYEYMVKVYNDYKLLHLHMTYLEQFNELAKKYNIKLLAFPMIEDPGHYIKNSISHIDTTYKDVLRWRWKNIRRYPNYKWDTRLGNIAATDNSELLGGMHFNEDVHKRYADLIYSQIGCK